AAPDASRATNSAPADTGKPPVMTAEELDAAIAAREAETSDAVKAMKGTQEGKASGSQVWTGGLMQFTTTGLFFMIVGCVFLLIAAVTLGPVHAAFSFVLVVVGVAILLFGTGTHSMGAFRSDEASAKYKVRIAGAAGILAFCIAFGIVKFSPEMKSAFQIEKKY